jgi:hypothetical protein
MRIVVGLAIIVACVLLAITVWRFTAYSQMVTAQDDKMRASFVANSGNQNLLLIRGWQRKELEQILADFLQLYGLADSSVLKMEAKSSDTFVITFPHDIEPKLLLFLVNYVQYPKKFDLTERSIGVLGRVVLTAAFGVPDTGLIGKQAVIYVPANDTEYDLVYARLESGGVYIIPFTSLIWKATDDARMPRTVAGL